MRKNIVHIALYNIIIFSATKDCAYNLLLNAAFLILLKTIFDLKIGNIIKDKLITIETPYDIKLLLFSKSVFFLNVWVL